MRCILKDRGRLLPLFSLVSACLLYAPASAAPLPTAQWLVDLGRDYPRTPQAGLSDYDAEITLLFMESASRVDPGLADAWLWQFDMLTALDRDAAARTALGRYVERQPDDMAAHLNWIDLEFESLQNAELRAQFCRDRLAAPHLPAKVASDLRRRLAQFHQNRGEFDQAREQAKLAVKAYSLNFTARDIMESLPPQPDARERSARLPELLLTMAASPSNSELAQHLGDELMWLNLPEPADRFYAQAVAVYRISDPQGRLPSALMRRIDALRALGKNDQAAELTSEASKEWKALLARMPGQIGPERSAEMAWFYAHHEPQPVEAEKLARVVMADDPKVVVASRALGAALRQQNKLDQAKAVLTPVAARDTWAAIELAQTLEALSEKEPARKVLQAASTQPAREDDRRALREWMSKSKLTPPASQPAAAQTAALVDGFPWPVLDYPLRPNQYASLVLSVQAGELAPAEPWILTATFKNQARFPITFGPDMMVVPDLLLSVDAEGDKPRTSGPTIRLSLNRTTVLQPGESISVTQTIKLGVVRSGMIGTPQVTHEVTVSGVLSPLSTVDDRGIETYVPAIGGLLATPARFKRTAFIPTEQSMKALMERLAAGNVSERIEALEILSMLLAEHQHLQAGRLSYRARPIDPAATQAAILNRAADPDWQVRARLAECLRWFMLDKVATNQATRLLNDPHWLVRGLAMRMFADHYGAKFENVLATAATADPDEWVKRMATALKARQAAASQPQADQEQK